MNASKAKNTVKENVGVIIDAVNSVLAGRNLSVIRPILRRIDSTGTDPHWFTELSRKKRLPNLDGKTVGSVIEKLTVCVMEHFLFDDGLHLSVNPAKGIDVPELDLGIKSPSTNFFTSEPFFSAYNRLLGNEFDALILLTNYQAAKKNAGHFNLKIIDARYLCGSEIADKNLCAVARNIREKFHGDTATLRTLFRFVSYVNQGDWAANAILKALETDMSDVNISSSIQISVDTAEAKNRRERNPDKRIAPGVIEQIRSIANMIPNKDGLVLAADKWIVSEMADSARYPNENEMRRLLRSPLDGKIGMSFALQWRYNFSSVFPERHKGE